MSGDEVLAAWLITMLDSEDDLRSPGSLAAEARRGARVPRILLHEEGEPVAYAELRRVGRAVELATVVVDPDYRGQGYCHRIVHEAWERWRQDPIVHGCSVMPEVDLARAMRTEEESSEPSVVRGPLVSFTRDAAMAAGLIGGGFSMVQRRRRFSRLWLYRSDLATLPLGIQFAFLIDRTLRGLRLLVSRPGRILHHLRHGRDYRLFIRHPADAERLPPRRVGERQQEAQAKAIAQDVINQLESIAFTMAEPPVDPASITAWDEGE